jgi:secretion/DNA translocation related TadE-like protein
VKRDSGSASVYVLGAVLLLAFMSVPVAVVASGFAAHRQAVVVADLAALGGAQVSLVDEALACSTAANVATENGARLQSCALSDGALRVEVAVSTSFALLPEISAASRAGVRPPLSG